MAFELLSEDKKPLYASSDHVAAFMEQQGWISNRTLAIRSMALPDGNIVDGVAVGTFLSKGTLLSPVVVGEAVSYPGSDGFFIRR